MKWDAILVRRLELGLSLYPFQESGHVPDKKYGYSSLMGYDDNFELEFLGEHGIKLSLNLVLTSTWAEKNIDKPINECDVRLFDSEMRRKFSGN